jgi:hypothetical protein
MLVFSMQHGRVEGARPWHPIHTILKNRTPRPQARSQLQNPRACATIDCIRRMNLVRIALREEPIMKPQTSTQIGMRRVLPVLGVFAGGAAYSVLPRGVFGEYDMLVRIAVTGVVAAATTLVLLLVERNRMARGNLGAMKRS